MPWHEKKKSNNSNLNILNSLNYTIWTKFKYDTHKSITTTEIQAPGLVQALKSCMGLNIILSTQPSKDSGVSAQHQNKLLIWFKI